MKYQNSESLGRYFKSIKNLDPLTKEEETELALKIKEGCRKSLNQLVEHNLKIVVTIANKNIGRGILVDDLIQQGNIGLYEAALRFDPSRDNKFASFASTRILKMMNHLIDECGRPVRIPVNQEYQRYLALKRGEEVENMQPVYIDAPLGEDGKESYGSRVLSNIQEDFNVEDICELERRVAKYLTLLNESEQQVLKLSFGLDGEPGMYNNEIAKILGVSTATVGNIKKRAYTKIQEHEKVSNNI